jgi:hypothetical protein
MVWKSTVYPQKDNKSLRLGWPYLKNIGKWTENNVRGLLFLSLQKYTNEDEELKTHGLIMMYKWAPWNE